MEEKLQEQKERQVVDVLPLKKGRRMLVFLADFFITLIFCFLLFNLASLPLGKVMTNYDNKNEIYETNVDNMHTVLYQNKILKVDPRYGEDDIDLNVEYTFDCWLSYYVLDTETSPNSLFRDFGHKVDNDVIYHFYNDIRNSNDKYVSLFTNYNAENGYFEQNGVVFALKENVKNTLAAYFDPKDEMGDTGGAYYNNLQKNVFTPLLSEIFSDIEANDLTYGDISYLVSMKEANKMKQYHDNLLTISTVVAYFLSWAIAFIAIPMFNKNHRTLGMIFMSIERINLTKLYVCKRSEAILNAIYALFTNMLLMFFMPVTYVSFNYLFSLSWLLYLGLVSIIFMIASFITILVNGFNRSVSDIFSRTVMITTVDLDNIYRAKGYNI